jgi:nucleoside-diphosphate-sugar epimerase
VTRLLVLGAGYVGAALAARAVAAGDEVTLADNWHATRREQAEQGVPGARVVDCDVRSRADVERVLAATAPDRVALLAAQASRPLSWRDPDYTEQANATGARLVAESVAALASPPAVLFGSSLHVYGTGLAGPVGADRPYGPQSDLAHLSKVYAELVLRLHAERAPFPLALLRLGIVYGPSPVEHDAPESVTVVDKFRRLAAAGQPLPLDAGGRATIGVVHVADVARVLHEHAPAGVEAHNVAAETVTVGDVAALAEGRAAAGDPDWTVDSPFAYTHGLAAYLGAPR